jgi:hypothetical protein
VWGIDTPATNNAGVLVRSSGGAIPPDHAVDDAPPAAIDVGYLPRAVAIDHCEVLFSVFAGQAQLESNEPSLFDLVQQVQNGPVLAPVRGIVTVCRHGISLSVTAIVVIAPALSSAV